MDLLTEYSNRSDLLDDLMRSLDGLRASQGSANDTAHAASVHSDHAPRPNWRVKDRLSNDDIETIIAAYQVGASIQELSERYGISWSSVKTLLRQRRIRRPKEHYRGGPLSRAINPAPTRPQEIA